jgi:UDP-N-acetylmuramate: L-alanyl-gamma-D-glutamyl-meso-diaminopimelate ligase
MKTHSQYDLEKVKNIYFMGIGGTGMAAVAGLCQQKGMNVSGSDGPLYPPTSTLLEDLGIRVHSPYAPENLDASCPDLVIVANALSRGHQELETMLERNIPHTSFPELLGRMFLQDNCSVTVTGTHGKTTTTSLVSVVLDTLQESPGFFIGGVPKNFNKSFDQGGGKVFVLEGDEYDTAFFDKGPKFLHYSPNVAVINAVEFDHADIYANLEEIILRFQELVEAMDPASYCVANFDDENVIDVLTRSSRTPNIIKISPYNNVDSDITIRNISRSTSLDGSCYEIDTKFWGRLKIDSCMMGPHNGSNIAHAIGALAALELSGVIQPLNSNRIQEAFASFTGVSRRLELLDEIAGIKIFEDFAHHPTAVKFTIETLRKQFPNNRIVIAFEPKNATARRNVFEKQYADVFKTADRLLIGECPVDQRIPESERMNTERLAKLAGSHVSSYSSNEDLLDELARMAQKGDVITFLSSSSFAGCQHRLGAALRSR